MTVVREVAEPEPWMKPFVEKILEDGEDDWVMIDNVIAYGWQMGARYGVEPEATSVELLRHLLDDQLMKIGELADTGFEPWEVSVDEAARKFIEGCERYDWEPLGALWWLAITAQGEEWLRCNR